MLLLINDKIVDKIKVNQTGDPIIPQDILSEVEASSSSIWPFIHIPSKEPYSKIECEIGYWDNINSSKSLCPIIIGYVSIVSISLYLEKEQVRKWSGGYEYKTDQFKLNYHYEIVLELKSGDNTCNYKFKSDDYFEINFGQIEHPRLNTMKKLFYTVIPEINEFISQGFPINLLNISHVQRNFPQKEKDYISKSYIHDYNWFIKVILSAQVKHALGNYFLEFGEGLMPIVNRHVAEVISEILGVRFLRESNDRYIYGIITSILKEIDNDDSLLKSYCIAKLLFNAEKLYSPEIANKEILLAVSSNINEPLYTKKPSVFFVPTCDIVRMMDFICNLTAEHKIRGQYRVGRDDYECEYQDYCFLLRDDYTPQLSLIRLINSVLEIKLEYKEADITNRNQQPRQYKYTRILEKGYVAWFARNDDLGSAKLTKSSIYNIIDMVYQIYKSDEKEFHNLL